EVGRVDVAAYHRKLPGWSVQQAARAARYQLLAAVASKRQAAAVLVGHTADDQAETLLINLLRGTGMAGLAGMRIDETFALDTLGPIVDLPEIYAQLQPVLEPQLVRVARPLLSI